jgi:hypothetical protein
MHSWGGFIEDRISQCVTVWVGLGPSVRRSLAAKNLNASRVSSP